STLELRQYWLPAVKLRLQMEVLRNAAQELNGTATGAQALSDATSAATAFHADDPDTVYAALEIIQNGWLGDKRGCGGSRLHTVIAIGNCHIDTAWLWPYAETKRKVARSWSRQVRLMDRYPAHRFVASQAQQFQWLEQDYPDVFDAVKEK